VGVVDVDLAGCATTRSSHNHLDLSIVIQIGNSQRAYLTAAKRMTFPFDVALVIVNGDGIPTAPHNNFQIAVTGKISQGDSRPDAAAALSPPFQRTRAAV